MMDKIYNDMNDGHCYYWGLLIIIILALLGSDIDQFYLHRQVEVSLAYQCTSNLSNDMILEYIHFNRLHNTLKINYLGKVSSNNTIFLVSILFHI